MKFKVYRSTILPVVLCGCDTGQVTLKDEYWLMVCMNTMVMKVFGPKRDKVTGDGQE
jgi:hypothetical protein